MLYAVYLHIIGCISLLSTPYLVVYTEAVIFRSRCKKVVEFVKEQYSAWYLQLFYHKNACDREVSCSFGFTFFNSTRPCSLATMMTFGVEFVALNFLMLKSFTSNYCMQDNVVGLSFFNSSNALYSEILRSFLWL